MIKNLIKKIRHQPKAARDKVALVIAGVFTFGVFSIWAYHLPERMSTITEGQEEDSSPGFSQILGEISDTFSSIKDAIPEDVDMKEIEADLAGTDDTNATSTLVTASSTLPVVSAGTSSSSGTNTASSASPARAIRIVTSSSSVATTSTPTTPAVE